MRAIDNTFYKTTAWKHVRRAYMRSQHGICERCGQPAKIVHHRIWLNDSNINDPEITLGWSNLEALCQSCHNEEHKAETQTDEKLFFDEDGNLKQIKK